MDVLDCGNGGLFEIDIVDGDDWVGGDFGGGGGIGKLDLPGGSSGGFPPGCLPGSVCVGLWGGENEREEEEGGG